MNNIPGLKIDVGFGSVNEKLPDWRKAKELGGSEQDPDDDQIETPEDVKAMLGFDPAEESKEDDMEQNRTTETFVMRLARNRCKDRARLEPGAVENAGTSEGVKKGWQKRKAGGEGRVSVWDAMTPAQRIRARSQDRQEAKKSAEKSRWTSRNCSMLEQVSPSPMIGKYAAGKARRSVLADKLAAKNAGTSEGVRKTWRTENKRTSTAFNAEQLAVGTKHEMEHTTDPKVARKIAADHLGEDPDYYVKLKKCMDD